MFDYNTIPADYYDVIYKKHIGMQSKWHHLKFDFLYRHIKPGASILDIGCGPGTFLGNMPFQALSVGLDISPSQISYANMTYGSKYRKFICGDVFSDAFSKYDNGFEYITLIEILEHLNKNYAAQVLTLCRKLLTPNGKILLSTPNYMSLWPIVEILVNSIGKVSYETQHILKLNKKSLAALLRCSGLEIVDLRTFMGFKTFLAAIDWRLPEKLPDMGLFPGLLLYAECIPGRN